MANMSIAAIAAAREGSYWYRRKVKPSALRSSSPEAMAALLRFGSSKKSTSGDAVCNFLVDCWVCNRKYRCVGRLA